MMGWGWGGGAGWMLLGLLLFVVLVVGAVVAVVLLAGGGAREHAATGPQWQGQGQGWSGQPPHSEAERILEERFARGEIDAEALASGREALRRR